MGGSSQALFAAAFGLSSTLSDGDRSTAVEANAAPLHVELVGLAGVGKTHLKHRLLDHLGNRCLDIMTLRPRIRHLPFLPAAVWRVAPLVLHVTSASPRRWVTLSGTLRRLMVYSWRELAALRAWPRPEFVLSEEGWFHKLRRLRRFMRPGTTYADLPVLVSTRLFRPDLVVFLTVDPLTACARKLQRWGVRVTPEELVKQYERSAALGQWEEDDLTRIDLDQASAAVGLRYVELNYTEDLDLLEGLIPILEGLRGQ